MPRSNILPGVRWKVFARDGFRCRYCGAMAGDVVLVIDHQFPVALGGRNNFDNLISACEECNQGKSDAQIPTFASMDVHYSAARVAATWLRHEWRCLFPTYDKRMDLSIDALIVVVRSSTSIADALDTLAIAADKCKEGHFGPEPWAMEGYTLSIAVANFAEWKIGWMDEDTGDNPTEADYIAYVARFWEETPY